MSDETSSPIVSVVMANFNGAAFIRDALRTAQAQTLRNIEIIVADDASTDDSAVLVAEIAAGDSRVRLLQARANAGPGATRNLCLDAARGRWIAVMDSDDLMHPERLERLVAAAERDAADIVADDLLIFDETAGVAPETCLRGRPAQSPFWVDAASYVRANVLFGGAQSLGYLKPILRASLIRRDGNGGAPRYDPALRIAEDYDFILRLLVGGARFRVYPELTYFYRKHSQSISHRLSRRTLEPMLQAHDDFQTRVAGADPTIDASMAERRASLRMALDFDTLIETLKRRDWLGAAKQAWHRPRVAGLLRGPMVDRLKRACRGLTVPSFNPGRLSDGGQSGRDAARRQVCVISRQRVIGSTNGSSVYLLSLCAALDRDGCDVHLLSPSPTVFGRWPAMRLRPEMGVFRSIRLRGSVRVGQWQIATNPSVAARAALGVIGKAALRLGLTAAEPLTRPAPYAVSQPWTRKDHLFVATHARPRADVVIADYAFLTDGIPYTLRPDAPSLVIMHDLFSSRSAQFGRLGSADSVAVLDETAEMTLLGQADAVVAIQGEEASLVKRRLPHRHVITAPMAITPMIAPQPGSGHSILFVGSNTAPNIFGLRWFLDSIWPAIRKAVPEATVLVAGSVCGTVHASPGIPTDGRVQLLGVVPDLAALYRDVAVVISPLQVGSGLKIKLIEALGHGKAVVATSITLQGVDETVRGGVAVADDPTAFAQAVIALLTDDERRRTQCAAALAIASTHFSAAACYADFLNFAVTRAGQKQGAPAM